MSFLNELNKTLGEDFNYKATENGALGYATTQNELVDVNFAVSSMRNWSESQIVDRFAKAFYENKVLAVKWLFYARDVRGGLGERRLFRTCIKFLVKNHVEYIKPLLSLIAEYGRWDDLFVFLGTSLEDDVITIIKDTLNEDLKDMKENKSISLLGKWLPSENASATETKQMARLIINKLGLSERKYRKMLTTLRAYLKVVETKMSSGKWNEINYKEVPSQANMLYNGAFLRNDEDRRREFLSALTKGETTINAGTLYPHDIVHKYSSNALKVDEAYEAMWKALPDLVNGNDSTIVVADGSGSMQRTVGKTGVSALSVANALAIYFAERCSGEFKNKYITFSNRPQLVNLGNNTLKDKIKIARRYNEVADTNIEAVFDLILVTANKAGMTQDELPKNILIVSDMEFNDCGGRYVNERLFTAIARKYASCGYKLPRLVFWNVNSSTGTIPVKENDLGVALVSGFSVNIFKMVMSNKLNPLDALIEVLDGDRYKRIGELLPQN